MDAWTALRESHEEVGLRRTASSSCASWSASPTPAAVAFGLSPPSSALSNVRSWPRRRPQNAEVSRASTVPLEHFLGTGPGYTVEDAQLEHYMFRRHSWHYHPRHPAPDPTDESPLQPWLLEHGSRIWGMTARAQQNLGLHRSAPLSALTPRRFLSTEILVHVAMIVFNRAPEHDWIPPGRPSRQPPGRGAAPPSLETTQRATDDSPHRAPHAA